MKAFNYNIKVGDCRRENGDWDGDITREITYEPSDKDLALAVADIVIQNEGYEKLDKNELADLLERYDLLDWLVDYYDEDLHEIFEDEAIEEYRNG
jgi:hypothetical protein